MYSQDARKSACRVLFTVHSHFKMENYYRIVEAVSEANSAKMEASVASNYT
eukprot:COSAG05_NODE_60_length_23142_cov_25.372130_25_plen_51_part_00